MSENRCTVFCEQHVALGAKMIKLAGWEMLVFYPTGILEEHLAIRKKAGLFDLSHMGKFLVRGSGALRFLQHLLSKNAEALDIKGRGAQYAFIPKETGGALDDAYLYHFLEKEYLLVVNATNQEKDWSYLQGLLNRFDDVELMHHREQITTLSLQGSRSREILTEIIQRGHLPEPSRNAVSTVNISGALVKVARIGYTGEPLCFELFGDREEGPTL